MITLSSLALGTYDAISAYDVAVANGFIGDEAAWLASLKGATGATGATGSVSAATGVTLEHIATPAAPAAGNTIIYGKSDGKIYKRPAAGAEEEIGAGGSLTLAGLTDVDTTTVPPTVGDTLVWDGTDWVPGAPATGGGGREVLTANRTYYVRTDGNDSNDGLADTAGGAFLTIQKAVDVAASVDGFYAVTISIAVGTFVENVTLYKNLVKSITINGAGSTTIINGGFLSEQANNYTIQNLKIIGGTGGGNNSYILAVESLLKISAITLGTESTSTYGAVRSDNATIRTIGNITIDGNITDLFVSSSGFVDLIGRTITYVGSPAFRYLFRAIGCGYIDRPNITQTGLRTFTTENRVENGGDIRSAF